MLARLEYDEKRDIRAELDTWLDTREWSTPFRAPIEPGDIVTDGEPEDDLGRVPAWWQGDEEASQSFFASMGVTDG